MKKKDFLTDNWEEMGLSIEEFKDTVAEVAKVTNFAKVNTKELSILSFRGVEEDGRLGFYRFNPMEVVRKNTEDPIAPHQIMSMKPSAILKKGDFQNLLNELMNDTGVLFYNGVRCMFVSKKVLTTRLQPFGLNGDFLGEKSYARDLMIAHQFGEKALFRTLITREENGISKVFSILGERYRHVPQDILVKIYDELTKGGVMGTPDCHFWQMDHFITKIQIEFPDKADEFQTLYGLPNKIVPGIILETSDTGDCSIRVKGTWRTNNSTSLHEEVAKKHIGNLKIADLLKDVESSIFSEYTKLPEALCELMSYDVTDPSWDLSTATGLSKNNKRIEGVLKSAFKKLKIVDAIGKQAEKELFSQLRYEFDEAAAYTAYDFAMNIMSLPERVSGLHPLTKEKLEKAVAKAPYIKYEDAKKSTSPIVLSA